MTLRVRAVLRRDARWLVWRGCDEDTGQPFLVKQVRPGAAHQCALGRQLAAEFRLLESLDHPNLLKPVRLAADRAVYTDALYPLDRHLALAGPLTPEQVVGVLAPATGVLEYLHLRRRGHTGVAPAAFLVGPCNELLFAPFADTPLGGTPPQPDLDSRYLAPELIDSGIGPWGASADLYALGYVALELLSGNRFGELFGLPHGANWLSWHADPERRLRDWKPRVPHVPPNLLEIVAGLITKRPEDRPFRTAGQLRVALRDSGVTADRSFARYEPSFDPESFGRC